MDIATFKSNFSGGTRANRFLIQGGVGIGASQKLHSFHVRSTFIPPITNFTLSVDAYGRKLNIPGDRQYAPWQLTIYDDLDDTATADQNNPKNLWRLFSQWHNNINNHANNTTSLQFPFTDYKTNWTIQHLDLNGNADPLKEFKLIGCWPKSVGDIDFNMTRRNFLNTFSVIMLYDEVSITGTDGT